MSIRTTLARIKRAILKKPFIKDKRFPSYWMDAVLGGEAAFIVQIGSNDGKTGDPLFPLLQKHQNWQGLFVEPVPYIFEKLKSNYPDTSRFRFENVAINDGESLTFYWVNKKAKATLPDLPYWYDQLGSFDAGHIIKNLGDRIKPFILSSKLEGITLPELFRRNAVEKVDVLHIDTEGYDWKILSQLDLQKIQPQFILYEFNHLSASELKASIEFLQKDYQLFDCGIDVLAVRNTIDKNTMEKLKNHLQPFSYKKNEEARE